MSSFIEKHIGMRSDHFGFIDFLNVAIVELVPFLADEMLAIGLIVAILGSSSVKANSVQVVSIMNFIILTPILNPPIDL